jgi:hypothetical protein
LGGWGRSGEPSRPVPLGKRHLHHQPAANNHEVVLRPSTILMGSPLPICGKPASQSSAGLLQESAPTRLATLPNHRAGWQRGNREKTRKNERFTRRFCHFATLPHDAGPSGLGCQLPGDGSGGEQPLASLCAGGRGHSYSSPDGPRVGFRWPGLPNRPQWVRWVTQKDLLRHPG